MKVGDLYIGRCKWHVKYYLASTCYYTDRICKSLVEIACPPETVARARRAMERCELNTGVTYSNKRAHESVMVVALTSSPAQFLNSFEHELRHLTDHILDAMQYPIGGEDVAYLVGDINSCLWKEIHEFICCNHQKCECMIDVKNDCPTSKKLKREHQLKELLKDLEQELPQPLFEQTKERFYDILDLD